MVSVEATVAIVLQNLTLLVVLQIFIHLSFVFSTARCVYDEGTHQLQFYKSSKDAFVKMPSGLVCNVTSLLSSGKPLLLLNVIHSFAS